MTNDQWGKKLGKVIYRDCNTGDLQVLRAVIMACNFYCNDHPDCQVITRVLQEAIHDNDCQIPEGGLQCVCKE